MGKGSKGGGGGGGVRPDLWYEAEARAKVNLRLRVFRPGADGFHLLETVFCRISLADRVRVRIGAGQGVSLTVVGPEFAPSGEDNLAARAAGLFRALTALEAGIEIELEKHVPVGSGLGGGSSDAAAVLRLLNEAIESPLSQAALVGHSAALGSDVPFFALDAPTALAWGRGHRLLAGPALEPRPFLVVLPQETVSTAEAYELLDRARASSPKDGSAESFALTWEDLGGWEGLQGLAGNDFEPVIFDRYPKLASLKEKLEGTNPLICMLSGSGSALFAVYGSDSERNAAAETLQGALPGARLLNASGPA